MFSYCGIIALRFSTKDHEISTDPDPQNKFCVTLYLFTVLIYIVVSAETQCNFVRTFNRKRNIVLENRKPCLISLI